MQKLAGKSWSPGGSPGKRDSPVTNHCTESLPLFPNEHKEDGVLERAFIPRTPTPPTGAKQGSKKHRDTLLQGGVLLETKATQGRDYNEESHSTEKRGSPPLSHALAEKSGSS